MERRTFLGLMGLGAVGFESPWLWPNEGIFNPCLEGPLPETLSRHELLQAAWDGLDPCRVWDGHVHLIGIGDGDTGVWITPKMQTFLKHPIQYVQRYFYQNAGCAEREGFVDHDYREHLLKLTRDFKPGVKFLLLAFDYNHDFAGHADAEHSAYHTPNAYAQRVARDAPDRFEWVASIHPYREDAVTALEAAVKDGARAVKWLPPAMGVDPASPKCDAFYEAMAKLNVPLLTHGGEELAVHGGAEQEFGNPLKLRRAMDAGVRVVVAHCASLGSGIDTDKGPNGPATSNFKLFARLMDESRYENILFGELSAITQRNRMGAPLKTLMERQDWHARLVNGSDYPLPGVMPLFSLTRFVEENYISENEAKVLSAVRRYNPILFDFALKRHLKLHGKKFAPIVFESRRVFDPPRAPANTPSVSPLPRKGKGG
jgi:mannonate dehydratase